MGAGDGGKGGRGGREERLQEALRANLRRRKQDTAAGADDAAFERRSAPLKPARHQTAIKKSERD